jgi:SAM-dependent methyltransferase
MASAYGKGRDYWDKRYQKDNEQFDWYQRYDTLSPYLNEYIPKTSRRILMVGCGNSRMSEHMTDDGYSTAAIINIDISPVVIEQMRERHPDMDWRVMNCTDMSSLESETFDGAIDKGTMDALLCGEGSTENADKLCSEVSRLLRPGASFILITYGQPKTRLHYLKPEKYGWDITQKTVAKPSATGAVDEKPDVHYIYIMTKKQPE